VNAAFRPHPWQSSGLFIRSGKSFAFTLIGSFVLLLAPTPAEAQAPATDSWLSIHRLPDGPTRHCIVARVVDGDSLECNGGIRVRLLLIDAPELRQGEIGRRARAALARMAPVGSTVRLELDVQRRDRYGRLLAYVFTADSILVNEELARQGFAVVAVYPPNVKYVEVIRAAVDSARVSGTGLWRSSAFDCSPADFRRGRCGTTRESRPGAPPR
jgi:micrococcal nuclease